ncbi:hypothetical protein GGX14DRAFT_398493 [Mycena pura]|uniref:Uncharacterized protein n=1 Tax=Mycena pura TaxID=153505 RepID=A0AAD6V720_9AGAR|nr:hypothetical protein GGX14DRAFT_398493 [Mycena pura]
MARSISSLISLVLLLASVGAAPAPAPAADPASSASDYGYGHGPASKSLSDTVSSIDTASASDSAIATASASGILSDASLGAGPSSAAYPASSDSYPAPSDSYAAPSDSYAAPSHTHSGSHGAHPSDSYSPDSCSDGPSAGPTGTALPPVPVSSDGGYSYRHGHGPSSAALTASAPPCPCASAPPEPEPCSESNGGVGPSASASAPVPLESDSASDYGPSLGLSASASAGPSDSASASVLLPSADSTLLGGSSASASASGPTSASASISQPVKPVNRHDGLAILTGVPFKSKPGASSATLNWTGRVGSKATMLGHNKKIPGGADPIIHSWIEISIGSPRDARDVHVDLFVGGYPLQSMACCGSSFSNKELSKIDRHLPPGGRSYPLASRVDESHITLCRPYSLTRDFKGACQWDALIPSAKGPRPASQSKSDWLGPIMVSVQVVTASVGVLPFPYVKGVLETVKTVLEAVEKVKKNRDTLKELCEDIAEITSIVQAKLSAYGYNVVEEMVCPCKEFDM